MQDGSDDRRPRGIGRFTRDRGGSIAPLFAIIIVPIIIAAGVGLDLARATSSRNNLQEAVDATSLALAHLAPGASQTALQTAANNWLNANLKDHNLNATTLTVTASTGEIDLVASSSINTALLGLVGQTKIPLQAHASSKWGVSSVEVALVLDNTYSMNQDNKLSSLVSAAGTLVDTLSSQAKGVPNAVKIGVVPFSISVNVGSSYQTASWMTGTLPSSYGQDVFITATDRFAMLSNMTGVNWAGCVEDRPMPYDVLDTAPGATAPGASYAAPKFVPFFAQDEPDGTYNLGGSNYPYVDSYLKDSAKDKGVQSDPAKYKGTPASGQSILSSSLGPGYNLGPNLGCGISPLLRLTTDMAAVKAKLNQMVASGETHIPIGLMWGWHLLSPNAPFSDGVAYGTPLVTKIIVLVTDGNNTYFTGWNGAYNSNYTGIGYSWQNRISTNGGSFTDPVTALNNRLSLVCSNMKAQGIVIYTVPLEVTDPTIKSLLQGCASSPSNYIDATSSSQLQSVFTNIAGSIGALRIAQ